MTAVSPSKAENEAVSGGKSLRETKTARQTIRAARHKGLLVMKTPFETKKTGKADIEGACEQICRNAEPSRRRGN
jgi:predicted transcriptional regulator